MAECWWLTMTKKFYENHAQGGRYEEKTICPTIVARYGTGGNNTPLVVEDEHCYCLAENTIGRQPQNGGNGRGYKEEVAFTLNATGVHAVAKGCVRKLTPVECERLQGFPDNYTRIPYRGKPEEDCPDSPRYKALGNSWAVPVVRWIGKRMDAAMRGELQ